MTKSRKLLLSALVIGLVSGVAGWATFSAFSSSTTNQVNAFAAGTVQIGSNDAGQALYNVSNQKPGSTVSRCIKVTYTGSLDSTVKLYTTSAIGSLGQYLNLTITPGTQSSATFPSCTGFTASGSAIYNGTLAAFAAASNSWDNGVSTFPSGATKWAQNDAVVYQVTLTLQDTNDANAGSAPGLTSGNHGFTFEARNQ